jgi:hypothetical protein
MFQNNEKIFKNVELEQIINCFGRCIFKSRSKSSNFRHELTIEKIGNRFYVALKFSHESLEAFKLMLQTITSKIVTFDFKISESLCPNSIWFPVSNEIINYGFKSLSPRICRAMYSFSIDLYTEVRKQNSMQKSSIKSKFLLIKRY